MRPARATARGCRDASAGRAARARCGWAWGASTAKRVPQPWSRLDRHAAPALPSRPMHVRDLMRAMEELAPTAHAEPWDNAGLIVGDPDAAIARVMLCVDCTAPVLADARARACEAIVAYHPVVFEARKRFTAGAGAGGVAFEAARAGIAVYCPHTALDAAEGGTNDVLADAAGLSQRAPLRAVEPRDAEYKLVTFVPEEHVGAVSRALFDAGAGHIGKYSACSFRAAGTGTFFGEAGASPVVGQAGRLEEAAEVRVETV